MVIQFHMMEETLGYYLFLRHHMLLSKEMEQGQKCGKF